MVMKLMTSSMKHQVLDVNRRCYSTSMAEEAAGYTLSAAADWTHALLAALTRLLSVFLAVSRLL